MAKQNGATPKKISEDKISELEGILTSAASGLSKMTAKKMFGCHALWADGNVFALVWKHGRIGVKLPEESLYEKLMSSSGAEPWKAGPMKMAHWVLVPESFHAKAAELKKWAQQAHALCIKLEKKAKPAPKKSKGEMKAKVAKKSASRKK
jgi:TfoX/Sxy family transcriptional regulator of competence genes